MRRNSDRPDRVATWQRPDGSIDALLQFSTEHGQMLGVAVACGWVFGSFSSCPFTVHFVPETRYIRWNGWKQAKRLTARIGQQTCGSGLVPTV
jgi:hypothetical protein